MRVAILVLVIVLAGCSGVPIVDDQDEPTLTESPEDEVEPTEEPDNNSLPEPGIDTSGDELTDREAVQLGLDPEMSYPPEFVNAINTVQKHNESADIIVERFLINDTIENKSHSTLYNYTSLAEQNPELIKTVNQELISNRSVEIIDKQIVVLLELNDETREEVVESENLGDDDWSNSGLKNWEELEHGTDILAIDTSGDGIPDGVSVHNNETYPNSDPLQKDVYLEIITHPESEISDEDISLIKKEFEDAPVSNPDGTEGINLHIIRTDGDPSKDDTWGSTQYRGMGYHYAAVVPGSWNDELYHERVNGYYSPGQGMVVFDRLTHNNAAVLMHELGHSLGLGEHLPGVDSRSIDFNDYESVMNYNRPDNYFGYSEGGEHVEGTNDWGQIECRLSDRAQLKMTSTITGPDLERPINEVQNFSETTYFELDEQEPSRCVLGFDITLTEDVIITTTEIDDPGSHWGVYDNESELGEDLGESDIREKKKVDFSDLDDSITINATINNTESFEQSQSIRVEHRDGERIDSESISLAPGDERTVALELDKNPNILDNAGTYEIKTDDTRALSRADVHVLIRVYILVR